MKPTALFTVAMAHMAFSVPTPWMAGDKILPLLNKDASSSQAPKTDNGKPFVLAASHRAPGPVAQKPGQSFSTIWEKWKKQQQHASAKTTVPKVANSRKDIPVLIITEMGELTVGIPSSSQKPSSKEAASPSTGSKQKVVSVPLSKPDKSVEKADNVSVTELGELSVGILSPVSSSSSSSSSSRPSTNSTLSPCPFYNVGNARSRDHDDVLIIGLVSTFLLVVVVVEAWGPVWRSVRNRFSSRRKGAIRLAEDETEKKTKPKSFRSDSS
ncbi:hypothetical protein B0T20DRAFT_89869 [Sordaria brevicollis]|uniref:Uncharacterized protein n=1 Tax=Sordaria brevicollis TaxID=83679 RepID=A0AAE0NWN2_SORBR|nr:hypothetical protein B0T20DRAFT_89869 [Sordaria brevicollis]